MKYARKNVTTAKYREQNKTSLNNLVQGFLKKKVVIVVADIQCRATVHRHQSK